MIRKKVQSAALSIHAVLCEDGFCHVLLVPVALDWSELTCVYCAVLDSLRPGERC